MTSIQSIARAPTTAADPADDKPRPTAGPKRWQGARRVVTAFLVASAAVAVVAGAQAIGPDAMAFVSTDNAYVKGDVTFVSPKVPGYVTAVLTENDRRVAPGQVLVQIDPTDYRSAVADADAAVAQAKAALRQIAAQRLLQQAQIQVADAGVVSAQATVGKTRADFARSDALVGEGAVSRQLFESAQADNIKAGSAVARDWCRITRAYRGFPDTKARRRSRQITAAGSLAPLPSRS